MHVRLALAVAGALLLAACSEDPEPTPKIPDPTSSSRSPSPSESETPEVESPEEFIRRWQATCDAMQASGKTSEYRALSPKCQACSDLADSVEDVYGDGGSISFDGARITSIEKVGGKPPTFEVSLRLPKTVILDGSGDKQVLPAGAMLLRVTLGSAGGDWVVNHYGVM